LTTGFNSKSRSISRKIQPLISAIDQYGKVLNVFSNASPGVLCSLWGAVRLVFTIAQNFEKYFLRLVDMVERIGDILPRYHTYASLLRSIAVYKLLWPQRI